MLGVACATSPTGHPQLRLVSDAEMARMSATAFQEVKSETPQTGDRELTSYVQCVARAITSETAPGVAWEVVVFESPDVNAFALPGGQIGVYTGILDVTEDQDQLAAVLAHEIAHVTAKHGNARVSAALAADAGLQLTALLAGTSTPAKRELLGLLGLGAQIGVLMPYGREQETEADTLGLRAMAEAGFDPAAAVQLWRNMQQVSGPQPPAFLSTHPSHEGRIEDLTAQLPAAKERYQAALRAGKSPQCSRDERTTVRPPPTTFDRKRGS